MFQLDPRVIKIASILYTSAYQIFMKVSFHVHHWYENLRSRKNLVSGQQEYLSSELNLSNQVMKT